MSQPFYTSAAHQDLVGILIFHREANERVEIRRLIPGDRDVTRL